MSAPKETKQWIVANKPTDEPVFSGDNATFKQQTASIPSLKQDQLLVKNIYMSNDPAQRGWISATIPPERLYVPPVEQGAPMRARCLGEIVESTSSEDKFAKGKYVLGQVNWQEYAVLDAKSVTPVQEIEGVSLTHYLGALGMTGITAYYGLMEIIKLTKDDSVVVSGAAGAVGVMCVQIAKRIVGCKKVIGIAGSDEKCKWVESMGADVCLNYKKDNFYKNLEKETDPFTDAFFDNVGGEILDFMLTRMARFGRIAACGAISNYNRESRPTGLQNYFQVVTMRLKIQGFIVIDYMHKAGEVIQFFTKALKEGKLKVGDEMETVVDTKFEDIPKTWWRLFEGQNQGKLITKLA